MFRESPFQLSNNYNTGPERERERRRSRIKTKQKYNKFSKTKPNKLLSLWNASCCVPAFHVLEFLFWKLTFSCLGSEHIMGAVGGTAQFSAGQEPWAPPAAGDDGAVGSVCLWDPMPCSFSPVLLFACAFCSRSAKGAVVVLVWCSIFLQQINALPPVLSCESLWKAVPSVPFAYVCLYKSLKAEFVCAVTFYQQQGSNQRRISPWLLFGF